MFGGHLHIAMVGAMGSGKSTIGRRVADGLGIPFVDNDVALGQRIGADAASIAAVRGPSVLHEAEAAVLLEALVRTDSAVVAAAASTIEDRRCRQALAARAFTVWLHGGVADLAARARRSPHRPLATDVSGQLARLGRRRDLLYAAVANLGVDVSANDAAAAATAIIEHLGKPSPSCRSC